MTPDPLTPEQRKSVEKALSTHYLRHGWRDLTAIVEVVLTAAIDAGLVVRAEELREAEAERDEAREQLDPILEALMPYWKAQESMRAEEAIRRLLAEREDIRAIIEDPKYEYAAGIRGEVERLFPNLGGE